MIYIIIASFIIQIQGWDELVGDPNQITKKMYEKLCSYQKKQIVSGQFKYFNELKEIVGVTPLIRGFDMQNYSPHNPWHDDWSAWDDGSVQAAIDWYHSKEVNKKGIVTFQWHWFSPMMGELRTSTFYSDQTTFQTDRAVIQGTNEYQATIRDLDAIAIQLKRLKDAEVPVLWRPLHEAGGRWFWWGAYGPTTCLKLYKMMFSRFVNYHQLNNLIWVWSSPELEWYPGKEYVDIIGYDSYPGFYNYDCNLNMYMQLHSIVQGSKLIALSEIGPIPNIDQCFESGAHWIYFMGWSDLIDKQNDIDHLKESYLNSHTIILEKV